VNPKRVGGGTLSAFQPPNVCSPKLDAEDLRRSGDARQAQALALIDEALPDDLTRDGWREIGQALLRIERRIGWAVGEWWRYGERRYGVRLDMLRELELEESYGTIRNCARVCAAFEPSRRRDNLSFSHHVEVANIAKADPATADKLLDKAQTERLTIRELRAEVRQARRETTLGRMRGPPPSAPSFDDGRRFEVWGHPTEHRVCVAIHPNEAGLRLAPIVEELGERAAAPRLAKLRKAERLEKEAKKLRAEAQEMQSQERARLKANIAAKHGPAFHFAETHDFTILDADFWTELRALMQAEVIARLFAEAAAANGRLRFDRSDYWGDMRFMGLSANGGEMRGAKWTGIGSADNFENMRPGGRS
jgi:hypothetical protein